MSNTYYLAIDIGASSGRHILSWIENGKMMLEEVYRFPNGFIEKDGVYCWDHEELFKHVKQGIKRCAEIGKKPSYLGIDTWGVDYCLIDENGDRVGDGVCYRDDRTNGMDAEVYKTFSAGELYARTGIQRQVYNTIYQLMAVKKNNPEQLEAAERILLTPDYLGFCLTGKAHNEYTIASTSQMVDVNAKEWDREIIEKLGYPQKLFGELYMPGTVLGNLRPEIAEEIGFDLTVLHSCSHDTASAVVAVPSTSSNIIYLSSGTWSLMGIEVEEPIPTERAFRHGFTNEGGYNGRYRFLKNIMGLWIVQSIRKEYEGKYSFSELADMAEAAGNVKYRINVNDDSFLMPKSMCEAIKAYCNAPDMTLGEMLGCVYYSLAECYAQTVREIMDISGKKIDTLHIIGGGSKDGYLNELTAKMCGIPVCAGPTEATSIGNILTMMLNTGVFANLDEARTCVSNSFDIIKY